MTTKNIVNGFRAGQPISRFDVVALLICLFLLFNSNFFFLLKGILGLHIASIQKVRTIVHVSLDSMEIAVNENVNVWVKKEFSLLYNKNKHY